MGEYTVHVKDPQPAAKALREIAELIERGEYRHLFGGVRIDQQQERRGHIITISSDLALIRIVKEPVDG